MFADRTTVPPWPSDVPGRPDAAPGLTGVAVVRGAGAPPTQHRLPRRAPASVGRRERHAFDLAAPWVPKDLATFHPVEEGWLVHNAGRFPMRVENDWLRSGETAFASGALVMLQRGDHRLRWTGLEAELSVSLAVRARRLDDQRIPYAVDSAIDRSAPGVGSYRGVPEAPMSAALRYRMAVLFRHLIERGPEPTDPVAAPARFLGVPPEELAWTAHRLRRRLNVVRGGDLQSLEELGAYLVHQTGELTAADLDP